MAQARRNLDDALRAVAGRAHGGHLRTPADFTMIGLG